jgi:hypothetical protein
VPEQIDPFVAYRFYDPPLPVPFSVRWTGKLLAPSSGQYHFRLDSIDESTLIIDGSKVVSVEKAGVAEGVCGWKRGCTTSRCSTWGGRGSPGPPDPTAQQIAKTILFSAFAVASFVAGQTLSVSGAYTMI